MHGLQRLAADGALLVAPLAEVAREHAQQFIRLGQVDVVQGQADAQLAHVLQVIVGRLVRGGRRGGRKADHIAVADWRHGRTRLAQLEWSAFAHAFGRRQQHAGLALAPRAAFQFGHPFAQLVPAIIQQGKQIIADCAGLGQPGIHDAFDGAGRLGKLRQADHAAAALQGMEGTAQHGQVFAAGRLLARQGQGGIDKGQHFARFGDEDVEHFRIQAGIGRRGIGCGRHGGRQRLVEQGHGHAAAGGDFFKRQRAEGTGGGIKVETPLGRLRIAAQHVDKEAQRADILRDLVERLGLVCLGSDGWQLQHGRLDLLHGGARVFLFQAGQLLLQLPQQGRHAVQASLARAVGIIVIEQFFHLPQACFHLVGQRGDGLPLFDLARQFPGGGRRRRLTGQ
ncbi:hypothetical protein D3C81_836860 [compost metagenome]